MTDEMKPPVKGELLPEAIYVEPKPATWGAMLFSAADPKNGRAVKYVRADNAVVIPADDFGRICEALAQSISFVEEAEEQKMVEVLCTIKKWLKRWNEALAIARKYGSAE